MFFNFFYELVLWLAALVSIPKGAYQYFYLKKYRTSLESRFGKNFPHIEKKGRPLVWIHAVSVGETKAIVPLAKTIKNQLNNPIIVISSVTETGHSEAKRSLAFADYHVYLPLDFSFIVKPIVKKTKPDLVILCETDFWYNFLRYSKGHGATIALANGKISERSAKRMGIFSTFSRKLFSLFSVMCVQNKTYKQRFQQIGVPENKLIITGNLKFDEEYPALESNELQKLKNQLGIESGDSVVVIGSSHDPEEKLLLGALKPLWDKHPALKVIVVPRHHERFGEVASFLETERIPFMRFSQLERKTGKEKVILLDAMGLLRKCYQIADIAIVAGSYTPKVGGHNILEPSFYRVPVIYGPHMHSQPELVALSKEYRAGLQLGVNEVAEAVDLLLTSEKERSRFTEAAFRLLADCKGATQRTWQSISADTEKKETYTTRGHIL